MTPRFGTRRFLQGLGACIALPLFPASRSARAAAAPAARQRATTATGAPLRTAFVYFPNGAIPARWWPSATGETFSLPATLAPLEGFRKHLQIMGGLDQSNADAGNDGGGDHARGNSVFLTSVRIKKSATDLFAGPSIDQVLANQIGALTRFRSLELSCDASRRAADCDSGYSCAYQYNVSWQSATTPMPPENNPRLLFERLFGAGEHGERAANAARRMNERRSVLDYVMAEARSLAARLDNGSRAKLDQYLTGVRDIEARIAQSERFGPNVDPDRPTPTGIPDTHAAYVELMFDMLLLAFQTDSTRIATFVLGHDGDNRSFSEIGITEGHHDLSHHQNDPERVEKVATIDRWYVEQFAKFLAKLATAVDVDGQSLLHNARILYGSGNADGNRHTHTNLPLVLAGAGGGLLKGGRHVKHGGQPLANLFLALAEQVGVSDLTTFGDSTGRLRNI